MNKNLLFFIVLLFSCCMAYSQDYTQRPEFIKANRNWIFADQQGLDQGTSPPTLQTSAITAVEAAAAVSDTATGALLFYSDGVQCWNRNHLVMPNGTGLLGHESTAQGACIVPVIGVPGRYYLFTLVGTVEAADAGHAPVLAYSIVDMTLDNGLGDIVAGQKNIILDTVSLSESMIAVPGNNCDIWLMVHKFQDPVFMAYHISATGLDPVPVVSVTSTTISGPHAFACGGMAISPNREMIALTSYGGDFTCLALGLVPDYGGGLIARFNPANGSVFDDVKLNDSLGGYSACFSPDNSKLYFTGYVLQASNMPMALLQYDVSNYTASTMIASGTIINAADNLIIAGMRSNGTKIYMPVTFGNGITTIDNPNGAGLACNFNPIPGIATVNTIRVALGNNTVYPLPPDTLFSKVLDSTFCSDQDLGFTLSAMAGFQGYLWNDGNTDAVRSINDPGVYWVLCQDDCHYRIDTFIIKGTDVSFSLGTDTTICEQVPVTLGVTDVEADASITWQDGTTAPTYTATRTGLYWATARKGNCSYTDSITITFTDELKIDLGADIVLCTGSPIAIMLGVNQPQGADLLWNTGSTEDHILASDTGTYSISVHLPPCYLKDSLHIGLELCTCSWAAPLAFSPNNDGLNDLFRPIIEPGCIVGGYKLSIYDRFGHRVFTGTHENEGWDGTISGIPADVGVYFYELKFNGGTRKQAYYKKGDITLLR